MNNPGALQVTARGEREIVITRTFDAPRRLVFEAYTRPELLKRWLLGPAGWLMPVCEVDLKVGGTYRMVWRNADGKELAMGGVYREIVVPERIVATEKFYDTGYEVESLSTLVLAEQRDTTTITQTILHASREIRDGVLKSGMEKGVAASYDRLAQLLAADKPGTTQRGAGAP